MGSEAGRELQSVNTHGFYGPKASGRDDSFPSYVGAQSVAKIILSEF